MIKLNNYFKEFKRGKRVLLDFYFRKGTKENTYEVGYNLNIENFKKIFKGEKFSVILMQTGTIINKFIGAFGIREDETTGIPESLNFTIDSGSIDSNSDLVKSFLKDTADMLNMTLQKDKKFLRKENFHSIINYYSQFDDNKERFILFDRKTNEIYEIKNNIDNSKLGEIKVTLMNEERDKFYSMKQPCFIHNHLNSIEFSENDKRAYSMLKNYFKDKNFLFLIYNQTKETITEIETNTYMFISGDKLDLEFKVENNEQ